MVEIVAHRGASGIAPENTMASIKKAIEIGVDWIEIDVRQTLDRVLIVIHDENLKRTTNGKGLVVTLPYKKIKTLDAGSWFDPKFKEETIPSLNEVLKLIKKADARLLIEVKGTKLAQPRLCENLIELIQKHEVYEQVVIQSFNAEFLKTLRRLDKKIVINSLINFQSKSFPIYIDRIPKLGNIYRVSKASAINPNHKIVTQAFVDQIHKSDKKLFCWTVDNPEDMRRLIDLKVDGIITNYPDRLKAILKAKQEA